MNRYFTTNEFYHLYNRGVDKRKIFLNKNDYIRFIHDLYEFNDFNPAPPFSRRATGKAKDSNVGYQVSNIKPRKILINLHAFVLMPNHHHLLTEQLKEKGISLFIRKLHLGYTNAFNSKYKRSGHLFQGTFKDVHLKNDRQFAHLICYTHANPLDLWKKNWKEKQLTKLEINEALKFLEKYRWSSHLDYLGIKNFPSLITKKFLLEFFNGTEGYKKFFIDWLQQYGKNIDSIQDLVIGG